MMHTSPGRTSLTLYEKRTDPQTICRSLLGLMRHLAHQGRSLPRSPSCGTTSEMVGELAGRPAAIVTYLERHVARAGRMSNTAVPSAWRWRRCTWLSEDFGNGAGQPSL